MNTLKLLSTLMIFLIISLPVSASQIISYRITGQDDISGVVREYDTLDIEAIVIATGDPEVTPDQLWMGRSTHFDQCAPGEDGTVCTLSTPKSGPRKFAEKEAFSINLHSDDHSSPPTAYSALATTSGYVVYDKHPPRVEVTLDKTMSNDNIAVVVEIYEDSYRVNAYDFCSGIKSVHLHSTDGSLDSLFEYGENYCSATENLNIDVSTIPEGDYTVTVDATDYMDNTKSTEFTFTVDRSAPSFSNIRLLDDNNNEITYIGLNPIQVTLVAETDLDLTMATGNFYGLNNIEEYKNKQGQCGVELGQMICRWNIVIKQSSYGDQLLRFTGTDETGNSNTQDITKNIERDVTGPKPLSITTSTISLNQKFLRRNNNTITATLSETGIGLDAEDILLDLSSIGGPNNLAADSCNQGWVCIWNNLNFVAPDGTYDIGVSIDSTDILGNLLIDQIRENIILDSSAPQIVSITVNSIGGGLINYDEFTTYGDSFEIIAQIYDTGTLLDAYGDFTAAISGATQVQADDCDDLGNGIWECTWITSPIDSTSYVNDNIRLTFSDYLGNTAKYEKGIIVYAIEQSYVDHWTNSVTCSPHMIDREVTSLIDQRIYCQVNLQGNAEILSLNLDDCTGDDSAKYVRSEELINGDTTSPLIKLTLHSADIESNQLSLSCPLIIMSQAGNSVTSVPELEEVRINIPFYNSPLGEYGENVQEKIDDAIDDATGGIWGIITGINKIVFYSERICSLITTINNVASLFRMVGAIGKTTGEIMEKYPPTTAAGVAMKEAGESKLTVSEYINQDIKTMWLGGQGTATQGINTYCKFISCRLFFDDVGWAGDFGDSVGGWQRGVMNYANVVATGGGAKIPLLDIQFGGQGVNAYTTTQTDERGGVAPGSLLQGGKLNPKDSLIMSALTLCIPGIAYNLDKYRQIKCMYADCLQTSVETGVPISACEESKEYETCKYVYGELFQLLPFTGLLDYFSGLIKGVLSSPFGIIDLVMAKLCMVPIKSPGGAGMATICLLKETAGVIADIWSDIANIKDDWTIKMDYCSRIDADDDDDDDDSSSKGGLFS